MKSIKKGLPPSKPENEPQKRSEVINLTFNASVFTPLFFSVEVSEKERSIATMLVPVDAWLLPAKREESLQAISEWYLERRGGYDDGN